MVLSMTGFASKIITMSLEDGSKVNLNVSIKSLNSRFFETTFKLPHLLSPLETEFIKLFKKRLIRGHIYCTIYISNQAALKSTIQPSMAVIDGYIKAAQNIQATHTIQGSLTLDALLQLPNIFLMEEKEIDQETAKAIMQALQELVDTLISVKQEEGKALKKDILNRITIMHEQMNLIEKDSLVLIQEQKNKVNQAMQEIEDDESKLAEARKNALFLVLDKMDINEEIVRFKSHLKSLEHHLETPDLEKGKRLDFTLQELAREINTIAAKAGDAAIGSYAINIKVELEKAREQVQNLV